MTEAPAQDGGNAMGLYVHWPFCLSKCPYCDFNSHVRAAVDHERWRAALLVELDHFAALTPGRRLNSIFFGGGTPSLMHPETVAAVIERASRHWAFAEGAEITLEANPTSVEAGKFAGFKAAGVNRVSLGVQALDDGALKALGREHSKTEALAALKIAKAHFDRVSFDLIYARPGQSLGEWQAELTRALDFAVDHLSLYQLTIEEGTAFANAYARGQLKMPGEDLAADLFEMTQEMMRDAGMPAYEISNHAAPGQESRHNLIYWRYLDYIGIGPGAHGRLSGLKDKPGAYFATAQWRKPETWLGQVEEKGYATETWEALEQSARAQEMLMMGLRLAEGISEAWFAARIGSPLDAFISAKGLSELSEAGLILQENTAGGKHLRVSPQGRALLNTITGKLLA